MPLLRSNEKTYKRWFDLAILMSTHLFPPLLAAFVLLWSLIPLLIWLQDRGPVFYRQKRVGKNGRVFTLLKFRTMTPDAGRMGLAWTIEGDRRVTRLGAILRKTALDELPGLLSVWKGDMSLVGPRALAIEEQEWLENEISGFERRLNVRPGFTGLAQLLDRDDRAHRKLHYDLEYIERMNPGLDLKLLLLSVRNTVLARWDSRTGKESPPAPSVQSGHPD